MSWFRIDDDASFHAKIVKAGNEAYGAWCRAGAWCSKHDRTGFIPLDVAHLIAPAKVWARSMKAGLLDTSDGEGYQIHDFNQYNPTDEELESRRESRRFAGRVGGTKSGEARRSKREASASLVREANAKQVLPKNEALAESVDMSMDEAKRNPIPIPYPDTNTSCLESARGAHAPEPTLVSLVHPPSESKKRPKKQARGEVCPDSDAEPAGVVAFAEKWKIPMGHTEFIRFVDFHRAKRTVFVDWSAAWRNWVRRSAEFASKPGPSGFRNGGKIVQQPPETGAIYAHEEF